MDEDDPSKERELPPPVAPEAIPPQMPELAAALPPSREDPEYPDDGRDTWVIVPLSLASAAIFCGIVYVLYLLVT